MSVGTLRPAGWLAATAIAGTCAVAVVFGLTTLAKPPQFARRVQAVENQADLAERLLRARSGGRTYPASAICPAATPAAAEALRAELSGLAALVRLEPRRIEVSIAPDQSPRLAAMTIRFEASGPYEAAVGALARLGQVRPLVLIDTVDLTSKTSFVTLAVSGRAFCSPAA